MIDIKIIREHPETVLKGLAKKQVKIDLQEIIDLDEEKRNLTVKIDEIRAEKKKTSQEISKLTAGAKEKRLKELKTKDATMDQMDKEIGKIDTKLQNLLVKIPNLPHDTVPEGTEAQNVVIKTVGKPTIFDFNIKDHIALGKDLDLIDIERAVKISGTRFYYLKNEAVQLHFALLNFALSKLMARGFIPVITPILVKEMAMYGTGFFPADKNEIYHVNPGEDDLYLIGTSEVPLVSMHANEIFAEKDLPKKYVGFSTCLRREAGSYGKDAKGILRVHQFDKVEMVVFSKPEDSYKIHDEIREIEEEIFTELGIPFQVINIAAGDLGAPAAKKYDLEGWIPSENRYREVTSTSNCTDFQSRRLAIRYKAKDGENKLVHTLNGTGIAIARALIAILENNQQKNGSIKIPDVLLPYIGKNKIEKRETRNGKRD